MPKQILFLRKVSVSVVLYRYPCRFPTGRNDSFISLKPKVSRKETKGFLLMKQTVVHVETSASEITGELNHPTTPAYI